MARIQIVAHRGGAGPDRDNTLEAFQHGIKLHADAIEMDMRFDHRQQRFYLEHNIFKLRRGRQNFIEKILPYLPKTTHLVIDLKTLAWLRKAVALHILELMQKYNLFSRSIIVSFYPFILFQLRRLNKELQIGFLCSSPVRYRMFQYFLYYVLKPQFVFFNHKILDEEKIAWARSKRMKIYTYTLNNRQGWRRAQQLGVDGLVTDYPREAKEELRSITARFI